MRVGNNFSASTDGKVYVGNNLKISGDGNTVTGNNNTVNGDGNTVTGNNNKINGDGNRCTGNNNTLKGDGNTATGSNNTINGKVGGGAKGGKKRGNSGIASFIGNVGDGGEVWINGKRATDEIQIGGSVLRGVAPGATIQKDANGGWSMRTGRVTMNFSGDGMVTNTFGGAAIPDLDNWDDYPNITGCIATGGEQVNVSDNQSSVPARCGAKGGFAGAAAAGDPVFIEVPRETEKDDPVAEDAPDSSSCIICTESVPVCAILPCMHKCVCCKCARELGKDGIAEQKSVKCPICRGEIEAIKRVY